MKDKVLWFVSALTLLISFILWPANPFDLSTTKVTIPAGTSARTVRQILIGQKILPSYTLFLPAVKIFGIQNRIKAGEYSFSPSDPLPRIIIKLLRSETVPPAQLRITFPEGMSIYKMGVALKEKRFLNWEKFQGLVHEGISSKSLEGYLFPDTYQFFAGASAEAAAEVMIGRFEEVVLPFWEKAKKDTSMSLHEIITLASIIEKEAKVPAERKIISSVFNNRLKSGMPLAADPTIKYALERPSKKVYFDQLSVRSPYNTYRRRGLPPGPICNPGLESIKAAVYPEKTNYYYFVAKPDGSHVFSRTWDEHQKARRRVAIPTQ